MFIRNNRRFWAGLVLAMAFIVYMALDSKLVKGEDGYAVIGRSIDEYAETLKPKIVLWLYFENDVIGRSGEMSGDLGLELRSALLTSYLKSDEFTQYLISRQGEIDSVLIQHAEEAIYALTQKEIAERRDIVQQKEGMS